MNEAIAAARYQILLGNSDYAVEREGSDVRGSVGSRRPSSSRKDESERS